MSIGAATSFEYSDPESGTDLEDMYERGPEEEQSEEEFDESASFV
jgi:hypothetical protein